MSTHICVMIYNMTDEQIKYLLYKLGNDRELCERIADRIMHYWETVNDGD